MRKETIKTLQGDCHENEKNNEIGGPNNSIKKRNERIIEAYQTENTSIAELAERFGVSKRTIGNVTHSLKEQNLQQQSLTNETTKEKEESNNQNIEAYLAGDLWVSKLVNKFNGSARTILMKIKKVREQKEEMQYKTSSENEILQLDRNSFEQREELVKQQELISEVPLKDELEQVHPAQPRPLEDKVISLRKQKSVDHDSQSKKYNLNDSSSRKRKMQENKDPEKFSLSAFPIDKDRLKTSSVKPKKPKKSHVLHEVEEYSPKLSQISKQIHTTENEHLIDENQQDKLQGISPQQNKNFSSSLPLPNKLEEATSSENHIFNSKQVQVTGSHLRENQEEHPILSETEGEFGNSLFDSLSDFDYSNESNEERLFFQKSANLSDELSNHNLTTDEIVEALMEFDETLDSGKNLVDYVNGSNELPKQSNNDLFDDSSNDSLTTDEIVEALMEIDETLDSAKNLVDYVNGSNELPNQSNNDLFEDSSNDSLTTDEIVEALMEIDETLDSAKKEACVLLWRGCSMTKTELSNKLNINIKGISLLVLLKREGKGLASSELFYPPLKNIREIMIKGLMKECRQQAFIQLNEKYQQNGHRIVEITDPYFISSDNKEEKRDLVGIRKHLKKEFAKYPKEEQSVKIEENRD
ncbi:MAG: hypothetical protein SOR82_10380, partial [Enterococcus hirae]|nr:hypothetical protein [Enterococcus hirae]